MKYDKMLFVIVLFFMACNSRPVKNDQRDKLPLTGFQNFEVITFFSPYNQFDQKGIYDAMIDSFKTLGKVTVSEEQSMFTTLPQLKATAPVCYFSIGTLQGRMEVLLDVIAEVEILSNHTKMACPIWKNKSSVKFSEDKNQLNLEIAGTIKKMVSDFAEEYSKANPGQMHPSFNVLEFKEL